MKTKALIVNESGDPGLIERDLPDIGDDELLMEVVVNTPGTCSYETYSLRQTIGIDFGGKVIGIGSNLEGWYQIRQRIGIHLTADEIRSGKYALLGGASQFVVIPKELIETGRVITYTNDAFYIGALARYAAGKAGNSSTSDIKKAADLSAAGKINPAAEVTAVGGITSEAEVYEQCIGQQVLFYTHLAFPFVRLDTLSSDSADSDFLKGLAEAVQNNGGKWCLEAELYVLQHAERI